MRRTLVGPSSTARPAPAAAPRPVVQKGGLAVSWRADVGGVACVAQSSACLAVATDDGAVVFVDTAGEITARSPQIADEGPNAMAFSHDGAWVVAAFDDGRARVVRTDGTLAVVHAVAPEAVAGKRARQVAATSCTTLDDDFVASAGKLVHCCSLTGDLIHAVTFEAPVRALCDASAGLFRGYAVAHGCVCVLVQRDGEVNWRYASQRPLRSLLARGDFVAAGTFDGAVQVWGGEDLAASLQSFCQSDGEALAWSADGAFLAVTGARAACFDFSGDRPPHPYRRDRGDGPDYIPRVLGFQDGSRERCVAWAPGGAILATADSTGVVRLWNLRGRLKKGGQGHPQRPEDMKPQFFLFPQLDAAHPSGASERPAFLGWLGPDVVAAVYECGDVVAFRVAPPPAVAAAPPPPLIFDKATDPKNVM
ncbi:unnamed protein product [Pelagomonas calceolata]|uniref:Uncharacterized protein n=1 Tax=Pelagomonas calceolata TaxID=35677 RepID=A0A8J2SKP0_9STRA|nr:unnamed protein product [Pelagomonas calceolata]